jgi:hypothetical protein
MNDITLDVLLALARTQIEHIVTRYDGLEKQLGRQRAQREVLQGKRDTESEIGMYLSMGELVPVHTVLLDACWPLALLWLDIEKNGVEVKEGDN